MTHFVQPRRPIRAPRVNLRGSVSATVQLENGRQVLAKIHQLSVTGGLLELSSYLEERSNVRLGLPLGFGIVRPEAEMLFPMCGPQGYLQPFRITRLWGEERQLLEAEITDLLKQTVVRSTVGPRSSLPPRSFKLDSF
ncbi:MAG: hypothetical protein DMG79_02350 [Acidobacteria bacterium]|nr:MAG: hypothetical protein DMG79_02350 [Acidobacteriota bacterium]